MKSMQFLFRPFGLVFGRLFHARSIIIISQRKTNHIALSGPLQFCAIVTMISCVVWASFSTGRYMATRSVLEQRDETIKSVANSRIDTNFSYTVANLPSQALGPVNSVYASLTDPSYALSAVSSNKLFARIALLENKVKELRSANAEIIQTVREKTHSKLLSMEDLIRQTGLNPDALKEEAAKQRPEHQKAADVLGKIPSEGGPFIPADTPDAVAESALTPDLENKLEQVELLATVLQSLPLGIPIAGAEVHSNFGRRVDPFTGQLAFHAGLDISGPVGTQIHAAGTGKVIYAGWEGAYGNAIEIDHGFGVVTRYGHLSSVGVAVGQMVKTGQIIGVQGSTGRSTGPHLHYEVRYNDHPLNPANFLHVAANVSQTE